MKGGIRAPRTPGGTWAYRIDSASGSDGRRGQRQVAGFSSREEAETALADALAAQGGDDVKTVAGFLERIWLPAKASDVERSTLDQYAWAVRRHVNPVLGSLKLADLGPEVLEGWLARLARPVPETGEAPLGATSVRVVRKVLWLQTDLVFTTPTGTGIALERFRHGVGPAHQHRRRPPSHARRVAPYWARPVTCGQLTASNVTRFGTDDSAAAST